MGHLLAFLKVLDRLMKTTKKLSLLVWNLNKAVKDSRQSFMNEHFYGIEAVLDAIYLDG